MLHPLQHGLRRPLGRLGRPARERCELESQTLDRGGKIPTGQGLDELVLEEEEARRGGVLEAEGFEAGEGAIPVPFQDRLSEVLDRLGLQRDAGLLLKRLSGVLIAQLNEGLVGWGRMGAGKSSRKGKFARPPPIICRNVKRGRKE